MLISHEKAVKIARLYYDDVYQLCLFRLKREEDAHDVTQKVFLLFQERCDELEEYKIKKWLYSVAERKIKEEFRDIAAREKELILGTVFGKCASTELVYELEIDNLISDEEIEEKKNSIISSLTEKELALFEMAYTKHMKYQEMAKELGISESALRTRICRLNLKIKQKVYFAFMVFLLLFMKI